MIKDLKTQKNGRWWKKEADRIHCLLCPRSCVLKPGQRGFCWCREATSEGMISSAYGRSSGFAIDPIEKKPLNHFFPGSQIFSFGTVGCNLGCKFCQNWDISKVKNSERLLAEVSPRGIAEAAQQEGCTNVAFTYNDPVIFAEYAIDTAQKCHHLGLRTVAVTAGYISATAREEFFAQMDATNIDLKGFSEEFYQEYCQGHLNPVLETIRYVAQKTKVWLELTTLLIPGANDQPEQIDAMTRWIVENAGRDVPLHFSAFHPTYHLTDRGPTDLQQLRDAKMIAEKNGLRFVYLGNVRDTQGSTTYCPRCGTSLITRQSYQVSFQNLENGLCGKCREKLPGHFV